MKKLNRILIGIAVLVIASGLAHNHAQDKSSASPVYVEHQKVDASYKHSLPIPDLFAGQSGNANYRVRASRHDDPTEVEIHTLDTDIFYVTTGTATFVAGGTAPDAKQISPTELRGKTINGATTYNLSQGDVIVVPRGIPHQFQAIPSAPFSIWRLRFVSVRKSSTWVVSSVIDGVVIGSIINNFRKPELWNHSHFFYGRNSCTG